METHMLHIAAQYLVYAATKASENNKISRGVRSKGCELFSHIWPLYTNGKHCILPHMHAMVAAQACISSL